jgi:hypothetical protein
MINVRRLVAVDLSGLGPKIIISEFALAVIGAPALGVFTLLRSRSPGGIVFGITLIGVGVNYVPLLVHAIDLVHHKQVETEIAAENTDRRAIHAKYRRQSLWLLLPFVVAVAAVCRTDKWRRFP